MSMCGDRAGDGPGYTCRLAWYSSSASCLARLLFRRSILVVDVFSGLIVAIPFVISMFVVLLEHFRC